MKKKIILSSLILCFIFNGAQAQKSYYNKYSTMLGVKFYPGAITLKESLHNNKAFEAIAYFYKGARITGLYEFHYGIEGIEGLRWYVGPGVHLSIYDPNYFGGRTYMGIDGVLGLDLRFNKIPFNFSLDWQPSIDFGEGSSSFVPGFGGLAIRYVIK
jgi:hypothetical protein